MSENNNQDIKVGDMVLVHDNSPRMSWKMAVVIGGNGLACIANIQTGSGMTKRLIVKLYGKQPK